MAQKQLDAQNFELAKKNKLGKGMGDKKLSNGSLDSEKMDAKKRADKIDNSNHLANNNNEDDLDEIMPDKDGEVKVANLKHIYEESDDEDEAPDKKNQKQILWKEIEFEHPELASYQELFWQLIFMPVVIFAGLGRLVVLSEKKTTVAHFSLA